MASPFQYIKNITFNFTPKIKEKQTKNIFRTGSYSNVDAFYTKSLDISLYFALNIYACVSVQYIYIL